MSDREYPLWPEVIPKVTANSPCIHRTPCYSRDVMHSYHSSVEWEIAQRVLTHYGKDPSNLPICCCLYYTLENELMEKYRIRAGLTEELPQKLHSESSVHYNTSNDFLYYNLIEQLARKANGI